MATEPGLATALRLPPVVFYRVVQNAEARSRRPPVRMGQTGTHCCGEVCGFGKSGSSERAVGPITLAYRNSNPANSARFLRQTIQVCIPGVSISVAFTFLVLSHARRL